MTRFVRSVALFLFLAPIAANVSGIWALNVVDQDSTHTQGYCTFKQDGETLTGTCGPEVSGGLPLTGRIDGNELSWQVESGPAFTAWTPHADKGSHAANAEVPVRCHRTAPRASGKSSELEVVARRAGARRDHLINGM